MPHELDMDMRPTVALITPASAWGNDTACLVPCLNAMGFDFVEYGLGGTDPVQRNEQVDDILREFDGQPPAALLMPESEFLDGAWLRDQLAGAIGVTRLRDYADAQGIPIVPVAMDWKGLGQLDSLELSEPVEQVRDRLLKALAKPPRAGIRLPDVFDDDGQAVVALFWLNRAFIAILSQERFKRLSDALTENFERKPEFRSLARLLIGSAEDVPNEKGIVHLPREYEADPSALRPIRINRNAVLLGPNPDDRLWWPFHDNTEEEQHEQD